MSDLTEIAKYFESESKKDLTVGILLIEFFKLYSYDFNPKDHVISIKHSENSFIRKKDYR